MNPASTAAAGCILVVGQRKWRVSPSDVLDVVHWPKLTAVPLQPAGVKPELLGVFEWNNAVLPVFDVGGLSQDERRRVVILNIRIRNMETAIGLAATDVVTAEDADTADLLGPADLATRLPKIRR